MLVFVGVRSWHASFDAGRNCTAIWQRLGKREFGAIDAQPVFHGSSNPGFGVDSASEVIVKVATFWHGDEKSSESKRIRAGNFQRTGGRLLAI
jgi:hypothetical protein